MYCLRFCLEYHAPDRVAACCVARFDFELVWLEYLPFLLALLTESWRPRQRNQEEGNLSL